MTEKSLTRICHSRGAAVMMFFIATATAAVALSLGLLPSFGIEDRFLFDIPDRLIPSPLISFLIGTAITGGAAATLIYVTGDYNPFRLRSSVSATIFIAMLLSVPSTICGFYSGMYLLAVIILCILLLFSVYQNKSQTRRVFLVFFILSTAGLFQYSLFLYVPVMMIGTMQMRVFSAKTFVAMLLGLITPFWILCGFGILDPTSIEMPTMKNVFSVFDKEELLPFAIAAGSIFFFGVLLLMLNFLKLVGYNARIRSAYGVMTVTLFATLLYSVIDYYNLPVYLPLMAWGTAFQVSHILMSRNGQRTYIAVILAAIYCIYLFVWNIIV